MVANCRSILPSLVEDVVQRVYTHPTGNCPVRTQKYTLYEVLLGGEGPLWHVRPDIFKAWNGVRQCHCTLPPMSTTQSSRTTYGGSDFGSTPRKSPRDTRVNYYDATGKLLSPQSLMFDVLMLSFHVAQRKTRTVSTHFGHFLIYPSSIWIITLDELPKIVQSAREGWMEVAKAVAIVCALLAGVEAQFIQIMGDPPLDSRVARAVRALNYISLLLNISAVVGTFFMLDILTELPFRVYKYGNRQEGERPTKQSISAMLLEFGADRRWTVSKLFTQGCAILGMLTAVVQVSKSILLSLALLMSHVNQIIVWVWMNERREVSVVVTLVGMSGVFLAIYWFTASLGRSRRILSES